MAANYWTSTHRQFWSLTPSQLSAHQSALNNTHPTLVSSFPLPPRPHINIFLLARLHQLAKRLPFRQQCIATAMVYMHRYLLTNMIQNTNLYLLAATAFYLASKTEESPHHIRIVASEARQAWPEYIAADVSKLGEMEFSLISEMHSQLIVWHPYRTLLTLKGDKELGLAGEEVGFAWSIINDSFLTDLPLTCPPHLIAIVAIFLAVIFQPNKAILGLHALPPQGGMDAFSSLGGRPGLPAALGGAAASLGAGTPQQPTSQPVLPAPTSVSIASARAKITTIALASEKIQKILNFLSDSEIDIDEMIYATQEIIGLYDIWETYNEKSVKEAIQRYLVGRDSK